MPKVIKKKANKDYPNEGIKKGDFYYSWEFRYGGKHKSLTYPKPAQLTQSDYMIAIYGFQETLEALVVEGSGIDLDALEALRDEIGELIDENQEKFDNLPEGFQQGPTGELLQQRIDSLQEAYDQIDQSADNIRDLLAELEDIEDDSSDKWTEKNSELEDSVEELTSVSFE